MNIFFKSVTIAVIFCAQFMAKATIVGLEELHNPKTKQTIIMISDMHSLSPNDEQTHKDTLSILHALKAPLVAEVFHKDLSSNSEEQPQLLLSKIAFSAHQENISVHGVEFRRCSGILAAIFIKIMIEKKTYKEIMDILLDKKLVEDLYAIYDCSLQQGYDAFCEVVPYVQKIAQNKDPETQAYCKSFDDLLVSCQDKFELIVQQIEAKESPEEFIRHIFKDLFIEKNEGCMLNKDSLWHLTEDAMHILFDACVLQKIHALQDSPVVCVYVGQNHVRNLVDNHLPSLGFEVKYKIKTDWEISDIKGTTDVQSLDIKAFIAKCSTLAANS